MNSSSRISERLLHPTPAIPLAVRGGGAVFIIIGLLVVLLFPTTPSNSRAWRAPAQSSAHRLASAVPAVTPTPVKAKRAHTDLLDHAYHITAEFGHYPNGGPHYGLDLDAWRGTIVHAPVNGTVTEVQRDCEEGDQSCGKGWGNHVWFQSAETGHYILIAHFQKISDWVAVGVTFDAGAPFGESGSTGFSSGPHVHIQVNPDQMGNPGSTNPGEEFFWLHTEMPVLGALFGASTP